MLEFHIYNTSIPFDKNFLGYCICNTVILTLEFDLFIRNFNLAHKIWTMSARALIFRMTNNSYNTFPWVPTFFYHVTLTLEFDLLSENIDLIDNFSTVSARIFIYNMGISCDKIVLLVLNRLTLIFDDFLKWTLVITSKIRIRALLLHMSISWNKIFLPVSRYLFLWLWPSLEFAIIGAFVFHKHVVLFWNYRWRTISYTVFQGPP